MVVVPPKLRPWAPGLVLGLGAFALTMIPGAASWADPSSRFPLRREGGGTRAACGARPVAHLVPPSSRLAPGATGLIALIEGPTNEPVPLVLRFDQGPPQLLPPRPAGLRVLRVPTSSAMRLWESYPACGAPQEPEAPPARSLLLPGEGGPSDGAVREQLRRLHVACGTSVATEPLLERFGYGDLRNGLPEQLPVHCDTLPPT